MCKDVVNKWKQFSVNLKGKVVILKSVKLKVGCFSDEPEHKLWRD